jgi:hypothetical protein
MPCPPKTKAAFEHTSLPPSAVAGSHFLFWEKRREPYVVEFLPQAYTTQEAVHLFLELSH